MKKRCTHSACRQMMPRGATVCPHCGKAYPRAAHTIWWMINGKSYNVHAVLQIPEAEKIRRIKLLRSMVPGLGLREAKNLVESDGRRMV